VPALTEESRYLPALSSSPRKYGLEILQKYPSFLIKKVRGLVKGMANTIRMLLNVYFLKGIHALTCLILVLLLEAVPAFATYEAGVLDVGNHLPPLEFKDLQGKGYRLDWDSSRPRALIIFFFEPRCADCIREMVFFDNLIGRAEDIGLEVFAVEASGLLPAETGEALRKYRRFYGEPSFPVIPDPDFTLSSRFGVQRVPSTFLVEKHGVVLSRTESFENRVAVDLARKTERLLKVEKGFLSSALRDLEIDAGVEKSLERSLRRRRADADERARLPRLLAVGDRVPTFEFTDLSDVSSQWSPTPGEANLSIVFFWGALCLPCIEEMAFLDAVFRSTHDLGLEIIAVEGSGLDPVRTGRVMERYQRFHPPPSYKIVPDPDFRLAGLFGIGNKIPQTFFIAGNGEIIYHTDEFIKGREGDLTRRIELALEMEYGSLDSKLTAIADRHPSPGIAREAPSIQVRLRGEEEFRANLVRGNTYYDYWEFDKALPHYLRCLELEPTHVSIHEKVASIYQRKGLLEDALGHWKIVLELDPNHPEALSRVESLRDQGVSEEGYL
jgi:peroxiredoxin